MQLCSSPAASPIPFSVYPDRTDFLLNTILVRIKVLDKLFRFPLENSKGIGFFIYIYSCQLPFFFFLFFSCLVQKRVRVSACWLLLTDYGVFVCLIDVSACACASVCSCYFAFLTVSVISVNFSQ